MRRAVTMASIAGVAAALLPWSAVSAEPVTPAAHALGPGANVTVMLELDTQSTSHAFRRARSRGVSPASAAIRQGDRVEAIANEVSARLNVDTHVLYTSRVLYPGVAVRTTADKVRALARIPGVRAVHTMVPKSVDHAVSVPLTGANTTWTNPGGTGAGVTVGIIDTGIDYTHADFGGPGTTTAYADANTPTAIARRKFGTIATMNRKSDSVTKRERKRAQT